MAKKKISERPPQITPLIGSLLRLPHEVVVTHIFEVLNTHNFDITSTELNIFMYPGPEGRRPIDLALQCSYLSGQVCGQGLENRHQGAVPAERSAPPEACVNHRPGLRSRQGLALRASRQEAGLGPDAGVYGPRGIQ